MILDVLAIWIYECITIRFIYFTMEGYTHTVASETLPFLASNTA